VERKCAAVASTLTNRQSISRVVYTEVRLMLY